MLKKYQKKKGDNNLKHEKNHLPKRTKEDSRVLNAPGSLYTNVIQKNNSRTSRKTDPANPSPKEMKNFSLVNHDQHRKRCEYFNLATDMLSHS